jgi:cation:H+ antiporter
MHARLIIENCAYLVRPLMNLFRKIGAVCEQFVRKKVTTSKLFNGPTLPMTLAVLRQRKLGGRLAPERTGLNRDMNYFPFAMVRQRRSQVDSQRKAS